MYDIDVIYLVFIMICHSTLLANIFVLIFEFMWMYPLLFVPIEKAEHNGRV